MKVKLRLREEKESGKTCDHCGKPISGDPVTRQMGSEVLYFCCEHCAEEVTGKDCC